MNLVSAAQLNQIVALIERRYNTLGAALGATPTEFGAAQASAGPLRAQLELLAAVANGELMRSMAQEEQLRAVEQALASVLDTLTSNPLGLAVRISDDFWQTDIGVLVSRVRWWLSVDELITISNAAALAFGENSQATRMRIVRAIDSGALDWFPDPSVANPQHNRRVLRPQVERLREQRQAHLIQLYENPRRNPPGK